MKVYINAYNNASEGAKELKGHLGALLIKPEGSKFKGGKNKLVINWGSRKASEEVMNSKVLNPPDKIAICADKLAFFKFIQAVNDSGEDYIRIPEWTTDINRAIMWTMKKGVALARTVLNGHSGEGIIVLDDDYLDKHPVPKAPLYTKYVPKKSEFRVHVMSGEVIDVQRKVRNKDVADEDVNWKIRNHGNGFIYARNDGLGEVPRDVKDQALACIRALGLDFGAVDIIYNEKDRAAYVLEVNTAPGLAGETGKIYADGFNKYFNG